MTGRDWAGSLGLEILPPFKGWFCPKDFEEEKLNREEFFLRCSNSEIKVNKNISRRDASKFKQQLLNNNVKSETKNPK